MNQIINKDQILSLSNTLVDDIGNLIEQARNHVANKYNSIQVLLNWTIGKRINDEFLNEERAKYGETIIEKISENLTLKYGRGHGRMNLFRMIKFAKIFPDQIIVSTLSRQLSWSHLVMVCAIEDDIKREFYSEMCRVQHWSVREFKKQIDSMLYERTAISKESEEVIRKNIELLKNTDEISASLTFKDPYFINFTGNGNYKSEADLEKLILDNITDFLTELGSGFCFSDRQKRMSTGRKDRYLDLLFFNRRLKRLIAIDLKIGEFDPAHKGQMEWHLNWLDKNERLPHEERPIGIILCAGKDKDDIEYLEMDKSGIHVAEYITQLPPKDILEQKLHKAIKVAKESYSRMLTLPNSDKKES